MQKKRFSYEYLLISLLLFILIIPNVNANFACGQINSPHQISAGWLQVQVAYTEKPQSHTTCKISPENNKFCCDPTQIQDVEWQIGKVLQAKISEGLYSTQTVQTTITGEGYDLFPTLNLRRFLNLTTANLSISNLTNWTTNFSITALANQIQTNQNLPESYKALPIYSEIYKNNAQETATLAYLKTSKNNPLIISSQKNLIQAAIFPKKEIENVAIFINHKPKQTPLHSTESFSIDTNINQEDIEKILIKFKVKKNSFLRQLNKVSLLHKTKTNSWEEIEISKYEEDEKFSYYQSLAQNKGTYSTKTEYSLRKLT